MDTEFWHDRWKQNEIGFHQADYNSHLQEFWPSLDLPAGSRVFVPLCGKSRDLLWLRARGHAVLGVEVSPIAVRDFFSENRIAPRITPDGPFQRWDTRDLSILCGDFFQLSRERLGDVSAVFDRASLIAMPPGLRERYAAHLRTLLPPRVTMLLVTMEYPPGPMPGPPFSVTEREVRALYEPHFEITTLLRKDVLAETPRLRERGLQALDELVYRLERFA